MGGKVSGHFCDRLGLPSVVWVIFVHKPRLTVAMLSFAVEGALEQGDLGII